MTIILKVGDRVVDRKTGEKGTVSRLSQDGAVVQVKWDSGQQQMLEVSSLKKELDEG
jgi:hypothetical protein